MYYGGRVDLMTDSASGTLTAVIVALVFMFIVLPVLLYLYDKARNS